MKKLLAGVVLALALVSCACGQTVLYKSQATLQWDAVTQTTDGQAFLPGDVVEYEVYVYNYSQGVVDAQNPLYLMFVAVTPELEQLIVFPYRAEWAAGVRVKLTDAGANVSYSAIAWSYVAADAPSPFVYSPSGSPAKPAGLQDAGT